MPHESLSASPTVSWTVCDGLFTMPIPDTWRYSPAGYTDGTFLLSSGDRLSFHLESFEDPESIAEGRLAVILSEPGLDMPVLDAKDIVGNVLMFVRSPDGNTGSSVIWKSLDILDASHIRVARFALPFDPEVDGPPSPESGLAGEITGLVQQGRFGSELKPLDRVAPTTALKRVTPWNLIHMRVPEFWRYERVDDGRYVCDVLPEFMPPDPTLWFDLDQYESPTGDGGSLAELQAFAEDLAERLGPPERVKLDHDEHGSWIETIGYGHAGDAAVVDYVIHRLVVGDGGRTMAHFNFVLTTDDARTSAGQELVELIHREIRNAIVLHRPQDA